MKSGNVYEFVNEIISYSEKVLNNFDPFWFDYEKVRNELLSRFFLSGGLAGEPEVTVFIQYTAHAESGIAFYWNREKGELMQKAVDLRLSRCREGILSSFQHAGEPLYKECIRSTKQENMAENDECSNCLPDDIRNMAGSLDNFIIVEREGLLGFSINFPWAGGDAYLQTLKGIMSQIMLYMAIYRQTGEVRKAFVYTARALARAAEAIDGETGNHILRVGEYSQELARHFYPEERIIEEIGYSAWMHDVGKMKIDPGILLKPGRLTSAEFNEMEIHTVYGVVILGDSPYLEMARQIALSHHEKWDGSGYPYGLKGEEIPLPARIVTVADVYDALRSKRPYKPPFSHADSCHIMLKGDDRISPDSHFCPEVLKVFRAHSERFNEIYEKLA